jgi:hypothetical protein
MATRLVLVSLAVGSIDQRRRPGLSWVQRRWQGPGWRVAGCSQIACPQTCFVATAVPNEIVAAHL